MSGCSREWTFTILLRLIYIYRAMPPQLHLHQSRTNQPHSNITMSNDPWNINDR